MMSREVFLVKLWGDLFPLLCYARCLGVEKLCRKLLLERRDGKGDPTHGKKD